MSLYQSENFTGDKSLKENSTHIDVDAEKWLAQFHDIRTRDMNSTRTDAFNDSWKLLNDAKSNGRLDHMEFESFTGPDHLTKMLDWIDHFEYGQLPSINDVAQLTSISEANDKAAATNLGLNIDHINLGNIAYYNAQDFSFQRQGIQPDRYKPKKILDFGAGHGRQANLLSHDIKSGLIDYCAMDATPACYLVQKMYMLALGIEVRDYIDHPSNNAMAFNHIPSWRFDLVETESLDMVIAVQVLRELTKPMLHFAVCEFARTLKPGGALYIRDHIGFHNPNAVDIDALLRSMGFVLEWHPHWIDRKDVHGIPRIWRRHDPQSVLGGV